MREVGRSELTTETKIRSSLNSSYYYYYHLFFNLRHSASNSTFCSRPKAARSLSHKLAMVYEAMTSFLTLNTQLASLRLFSGDKTMRARLVFKRQCFRPQDALPAVWDFFQASTSLMLLLFILRFSGQAVGLVLAHVCSHLAAQYPTRGLKMLNNDRAHIVPLKSQARLSVVLDRARLTAQSRSQFC